MRRSPLLGWPGAVAAPGAEEAVAAANTNVPARSEATYDSAGSDDSMGLAGAGPFCPALVDAAVPAHFGSPLREQAALLEGRAVTALACDVVAVTGPDRLSWLTTLSSRVHTALSPQHPGVEALILDAQGRIRHAYAALDDGTTTYLLTDAGRGPGLAEFLGSMRFMLRVEVATRDDLAVLGAMGEGRVALEAAARDAGVLVGTWRDPWPGIVEGGTAYDVGLGSAERPFKHPGAGWGAGLVLVPVEAMRDVAREFLNGATAAPGNASADAVDLAATSSEQADPSEQPEPSGVRDEAAGSSSQRSAASPAGKRCLAGALAWEALRVEAGRPRLAREVDERAIPNELDWLRTAVHVSKGCYPGQETVARTLNLGRPPRRLSILQLDGLSGDLPVPGAVVRFGGRPVGAVTSVAQHHELGPIALALLRRNTPLDAELVVEVSEDGAELGGAGAAGGAGDCGAAALTVAAAQEPLVSPEGKARVSPQERPGAGLRPVAATRPGFLR